VICSLGAIQCFSLTSKRLLHESGMRGIIFGAILLAFSVGLGGANRALNTGLGTASAILILIAGAIAFVLQDSVLPRAPISVPQQVASRRTK
jgi:hypothetical protein